jgi:hypothetical protein
MYPRVTGHYSLVLVSSHFSIQIPVSWALAEFKTDYRTRTIQKVPGLPGTYVDLKSRPCHDILPPGLLNRGEPQGAAHTP